MSDLAADARPGCGRVLPALGCVCALLAASCSRVAHVEFLPQPVADVFGELAGEEGAAPGPEEGELAPDAGPGLFPDGFGVQFAYATHPSTTTYDVSNRLDIGVYYHFAESENKRLEVGLEYVPYWDDPEVSRYFTFWCNRVNYIGQAGLFYWTYGAGGIYDHWLDKNMTARDELFGLLQAGVGYWLELGQSGLDVRLRMQLPFGREQNAKLVMVLGVAYDM